MLHDKWLMRASGLGLLGLGFACGEAGGLAPGEEGAGGSGAGASGQGAGAQGNAGGATDNPNVDVVQEPEPEDPTENLPGVTTEVTGPPEGCVGSSSAQRILLSLSESVPVARAELRGGNLYVNDTACTTADDQPITISGVTAFDVAGSAADEAVVIDLSSGDWSSVADRENGFQLTLRGGEDSVVVVFGDEADTVRHAVLDGEPVLDIGGDGTINLLATGATSVGLRLGGGDDTVDDLVEFLLARSTEEPPTLPEGLEGLARLSWPLLAFGADGDDSITGGMGDDELGGGAGNDTLNGLEGGDIFTGAPSADGSDTLNGGPDFDLVTYRARVENLTLKLCISATLLGCGDGSCECEPSGEPSESDRLVNIESVTGGGGDDVIFGTEVAETLIGGDGDDELHGMAGQDVLLGQRGADLLDGGLDEDVCDPEPTESPEACEI